LSIFQVLHHKQNKGRDSDTLDSGHRYDSHTDSVKKQQYNLLKKRSSISSISGTEQTVSDHDVALQRLPDSNVPFNFANIQTKLKVSQPGDAYEQEADRVAKHIIQMYSVS
jgi:hypothetical protein